MFQAICSFRMSIVGLDGCIRLVLIHNNSSKFSKVAREEKPALKLIDEEQHPFQYYSFFLVEVQGLKTNQITQKHVGQSHKVVTSKGLFRSCP